MRVSFVFPFLVFILFSSCSGSGYEPRELEFYKLNIVSPNPRQTFDSIQRAHDLPVYWDFYEGDGFASGALLLSNALLEIKTYYDTTVTRPEPMELVLISDLPATTAYDKIREMGVEVNEPFRREGWFWSVLTLPGLKLLGEKSNGVYVTRYDDYEASGYSLDSAQSLISKKLESIMVHGPQVDKFTKEWGKLKFSGEVPEIVFAEDSRARIEIVIN